MSTDKEKRFTSEQLRAVMSDIHNQPRWRDAAAKAAAYYDGDQLSAEVFRTLLERGQPPTVHNLIAPTIDGALGMEAKTRTDLQIIADDKGEQYDQLAQALNAHFADICRLAGMSKARSEAYADMIKTGFGVLEVWRDTDPFAETDYRIRKVHRDEVYWDWTSKEPDWSDARWVMRQRWLDTDEAKARFPRMAQIIDNGLNGWQGFISTELTEHTDPYLACAWTDWQQWDSHSFEWILRGKRPRVKLQVIYYRVYRSVLVIKLPDGRTLEYDQQNQAMNMALAMDKATLARGVTSVIREAWFIGPHLIQDIPCRAPQGSFPLVPFWGFRKDATAEPYGLISRAIPAQDEVNFRRMKLTHTLNNKQVIMDEDATQMSREEVAENLERPDGIIILNPDRRNKTTAADALQIQQNGQIASQQFQVMRDSMQTIQDSMGIYAAMLGQQSNATSGVAISNLVEQGATTLAEINDNYSYASQQTGKLLLNYLIEDLKQQENVQIQTSDQAQTHIVINQRNDDGSLSNDISRIRTHVALAPVQQTSAWKAQMASQLSGVIQTLPPQVQAVVLDLWLEMLDLPQKDTFISRVREATGISKPQEEMTPQEQQQAQEQQQQMQQQQQQMQQLQQAASELQLREMAAKVARLEAETGRISAATEKDQAHAQGQRFVDALHQARAGKLITEMQQMPQS